MCLIRTIHLDSYESYRNCNIVKSGRLCSEQFDDKPANKDEIYELVNNQKDDQMGKQVSKWNSLPNL